MNHLLLIKAEVVNQNVPYQPNQLRKRNNTSPLIYKNKTHDFDRQACLNWKALRYFVWAIGDQTFSLNQHIIIHIK